MASNGCRKPFTNILRKYADMLYRRRLARWESNNLTYRELDHTDDNFRFNISDDGSTGQYIVKVPRENRDLARDVEKLIADCNTLCQGDQGTLAANPLRPTPLPAFARGK